MDHWGQEGGCQTTKADERRKEIEALKEKIKDAKKEMIGEVTAGLGGLGTLLVIAGAAKPFPAFVLWVGISFILLSVLGIFLAWRI